MGMQRAVRFGYPIHSHPTNQTNLNQKTLIKQVFKEVLHQTRGMELAKMLWLKSPNCAYGIVSVSWGLWVASKLGFLIEALPPPITLSLTNPVPKYIYSTAEVWLERRSTYTRSLAVMSMAGYILGALLKKWRLKQSKRKSIPHRIDAHRP